METRSVKISVELYERLKELRRDTGRFMTWHMDVALKDYLQKFNEQGE